MTKHSTVLAEIPSRSSTFCNLGQTELIFEETFSEKYETSLGEIYEAGTKKMQRDYKSLHILGVYSRLTERVEDRSPLITGANSSLRKCQHGITDLTQ